MAGVDAFAVFIKIRGKVSFFFKIMLIFRLLENPISSSTSEPKRSKYYYANLNFDPKRYEMFILNSKLSLTYDLFLIASFLLLTLFYF